MVTSREPLGIAGEAIRQVRPLSVPGPREAARPDRVSAYEAVRLFVERASAIQAGFTLDAYVAPAVAEICRRLDAIPLALELARRSVRVP